MQTKWFQHLKTEQEREQFKKEVASCKKVLDRLSEIVYNTIQESEFVKKADYESASWSHEQAHRNGAAEALREIRKLLDLDQR